MITECCAKGCTRKATHIFEVSVWPLERKASSPAQFEIFRPVCEPCARLSDISMIDDETWGFIQDAMGEKPDRASALLSLLDYRVH